jgi:glycosyltransferase involved in cell wall biosynthesis
MVLPISIIIPTYNEAKFLPRLLISLRQSPFQPKEIIVADAFSSDNTREIAGAFGCRIVDGGLPAKGRNSGARIASEDWLLFLDADMVPPAYFLGSILDEAEQRNLDIAACFGAPSSNSKIDFLLIDGTNLFMKLTARLLPHGGAPCIFTRKEVHNIIGGFDETLFLAEDHDYVRRAAKLVKFGYLNNTRVTMSTRRLTKEGRLKLVAKYTISEMHQILIGPIRKQIFEYEFGNHREE